MLLPMLSTDNMQFISAGAGYSRLEKTILIRDYEPAHEILDICVGNPNDRLDRGAMNCSKCWKCSRALVTLEALGVLDKFSNVFDIEFYLENRDAAMKTIRLSAYQGKPADRDVLMFLKEKGIAVPYPYFEIWSSEFRSRLRNIPLLRKLYRFFKSTFRSV